MPLCLRASICERWCGDLLVKNVRKPYNERVYYGDTIESTDMRPHIRAA